MPKISVKHTEEWKVYQNRVKQDVLFAYSAYPDEEAKLQEVAAQLPSDYEMILYTDSLDDTKQHSYRAAVYVNHKTKEVLVANCGTRFGINAESREDLWNDGYLAAGQVPPKFNSALEINKIILDSLGQEAKNYKFRYTGHSLGAYIAAAQASALALEMQERGIPIRDITGKPKISSMTFENPGARRVIDKLYKDKGLNPDQHLNDVDHTVVNNKKNFINQLGEQAGKVYEIVGEGTAKEPSTFQAFCQHVALTLKSWGLPCKLFEVGAYGSLREQISSHLLDKFVNVIIEEKGDIVTGKDENRPRKSFLELVSGCVEVACNIGIFKRLRGLKDSGVTVGKQEFVMAPEETTIQEIEMVTFSNEELKKAARENERVPNSFDPKKIIEKRTPNFVDRVGKLISEEVKRWKPLSVEEALQEKGRKL